MRIGKLIYLSPDDLRRFKRARDNSRRFLPITVKLRLSEDEVATALSAAFEKITGQHVINTVTHRWLYAKADAPGANRYLWDPTQKLGAIGDWLCQGNVEGAWMSGALCADHLLNSELETT